MFFSLTLFWNLQRSFYCLESVVIWLHIWFYGVYQNLNFTWFQNSKNPALLKLYKFFNILYFLVKFTVKILIYLNIFVGESTFLPSFAAENSVAALHHVGFSFLLGRSGCKLRQAPISSKKKLSWQNSCLWNRFEFFVCNLSLNMLICRREFFEEYSWVFFWLLFWNFETSLKSLKTICSSLMPCKDDQCSILVVVQVDRMKPWCHNNFTSDRPI